MNSTNKSQQFEASEDAFNSENHMRYGSRMYSSLSVEDCCNNNWSTHHSLPTNTSDHLASTTSLAYCTGRRKRKHASKYLGSSEDIGIGNSFSGFYSDNLSRESLRNSCQCIDDLSDNDLREVQTTPGNFQSRLPGLKRPVFDKNFLIKRKNSEESPLYVEDYQGNDIIPSTNDETFNALRELDAVLDIHDPSNGSASSTELEPTNIEDCLLELDDYLDQMDEVTTMTSSINFASNDENLAVDFHRGDHLRRTVGCRPELRECIISNAMPKYATFGRNSSISGSIDTLNAKLENVKTACKTNGQLEELIPTMTSVDQSFISEFSRSFDGRHSFSQNDCSDTFSSNATQVLTEDQIFQNLIEQTENLRVGSENRPRQYGRRAERTSQMSMPEESDSNRLCLNENNVRPRSAPATALSPMRSSGQLSNNAIGYVVSDSSTVRSSRNTSPVTIISSSDSSESSTTSHNIMESSLVINEDNSQQSNNLSADPENMDTSQKPGINTYWPHNYSRTLALISCTLGLFNICRFAVLTINYGPNFLIQFLLLSIIFGVPFFWLQMCLGAKIRAGPVSMWKISPICSGIGIALILVQYFIAVYSSVVIVWLLVYLSDTFIYQSSYRWAEPINFMIPRNFSHIYSNLTESVPDYFNINVLQRLQILKLFESSGIRVRINDRLAFYLAILWAMVFLILCKGLRSFGKVIFIIGILPLIALAVVTGKLLYVVDLMKIQNVFSASELDDFLINSKTWTAAAQETFLTWGLLGASVIAITSRASKNQSKISLKTDAILAVLVTLIGLCLSALMGLCCIQILNQSGYMYVPGSYEKPGTYASVYSLKSSLTSDIISYPTKLVPHYSSLIGEVYRRQSDVKTISGYQILRFVTELFPAVLTIAGDSFSWPWAALVFLMLFIFGISQLCVMWKPISSALGNSTSAVLLSCVTGLLLSIPFATEVGITLLHYMDSLIGGAWFIAVLWAAEIFGVFLIRGRPYNGDDLVNDLKMSGSMSAFLALSWNVLLPISLIALAVIEYKISLSSQLYYWRGRSYYTYWARKVGALTQIGFLLLVPIISIIQIYRYLTSGPPDILDRIQMLYRPMEGSVSSRPLNISHRENLDARYRQNRNGYSTENGNTSLQNDAPPKYTPPPSYTTATGARLAKILRQSIRRSVRRILGDSGRTRPILSIQIEQNDNHTTFPPEYSSASVDQSSISNEVANSISETIEITNRPVNNLIYGRSLSLGRKNLKRKAAEKVQNLNRPTSAPRDNTGFNIFDPSRRSIRAPRPYTAEDVITILRSSTRNRTSHVTRNQMVFRSIENLVLNAEPPGISSSILSEHLNENVNNDSSVI
ncbi:sodium-dependent transporter bedraggled isoform X2 [Haematobia irritans]|uniref:sodium-dependent transporter bedraggled isoform X2 n=1 Tax=Haematobia irritans TaxID=7368 RepID=UPI003F4F5E93